MEYDPDVASPSAHLSVRCSPEAKARYLVAAERLGVDLSTMALSTLDAITGSVVDEGWECRVVWLDGDRIVGVGAGVPMEAGLPVPALSFELVAPGSFWSYLEQRFAR